MSHLGKQQWTDNAALRCNTVHCCIAGGGVVPILTDYGLLVKMTRIQFYKRVVRPRRLSFASCCGIIVLKDELNRILT